MFDVHVHSAPDVSERLATDRQLVAHYEEAGFSGCVLKGHHDQTAGRAALVQADTSIAVFGGIALNATVGGVNPAAVAACLSMGGRIVWLPTEDSHTQETAGLPRMHRSRPRLDGRTLALPPVGRSTESDLLTVLDLVSEADAVLATGHASAPECQWVVHHARAAGVRRILLTHPSYTVPAMTPAEVSELTTQGAMYEVTAYQLLHQQGVDASHLADFIRRAGPQALVLSSDVGQPNSPLPAEALRRLVDELAREGIDRRDLEAAVSTRPEALIRP